ncbi:MAG: hypothetical protein LUD51_05010 [Clostridia bacterium]|nr:hypothetical protein [Clostridia bacterium]
MKTGFKITATVMSLAFASLLILPACSGCNDDEDTSGTTVSLQSTNLSGVYTTDEEINFSDITMTIKVSYSDGTSKTLSSFVFEDSNYTSSTSADFIVYTEGFYNNAVNRNGSNMTEGEYPISCKLVEDDNTYDLGMTVTVTSDVEKDFSLIQASAPSLYTTYTQNTARVDTSTERDENNFYEKPEYYEVGDDNPFVFSPSLLLRKSGASSSDSGSMAYMYNPAVTSSVKYNGSDLNTDNEYVTVNGSSFQFTENAIGKVFTVSVTPALYSSNQNITAYSMEVKVEDGYNVYTPKDLGRISLVNDNFNASEYELGKPKAASWYTGLDSTTGAPVLTDNVVMGDLWKNFLKENGADESGLVPVHGIFIHSDLTVTQSDIPSAYFVSKEEAQAAANKYSADYDELVGSIRDWSFLYAHYLGTDENFIFNGNLFNIDLSQISLAITCTDYDNFYYPANYTGMYYGGSEIAFVFNGKTNAARNNATVASSVTFENVESIGNTSGLLSDTEGKTIGSLQFLRCDTTHIDVTNCIIKNQRMAFYSEYTDSAYEGFTVKDTKVFDCYNGAITAYMSAKNSFTNCDLERFGGPISIASCRNETNTSGYCYAGVTMDKDTIAENYMTGDEAWFTLRGIDKAIAPIKSMDEYLEAYGKTYLTEDGKFNLYFAITDIDYVSAVKEEGGYDGYLYGDFSYGNSTAFHLDDSMNYSATEGTQEYYTALINNAINAELNQKLGNQTVEQLVGSNIPIFMTNTGKIFFPWTNNTFKNMSASDCNSLLGLMGAIEIQKDEQYFTDEDTIVYFVYPYGSAIVGVALELMDYNA